MKDCRNLIFNLDSLHNFADYGIEIPLLNQRVLKTLQFLKENYLVRESQYPLISDQDILLAHTEKYLTQIKLTPETVVMNTYELISADGSYNRFNPTNAKLPLSDLIDKAKMHIAGTYLSAKSALFGNFSYHLGGGMHHSMSYRPGGFCMFNDLVIAAKKLQDENLISKVVIIDLDCHKGDGTAEITQNDESIKTFSIHMANGWPIDKDSKLIDGSINPSFIKSNLDIGVENSKNYLDKLVEGLDKILNEPFDLAMVVHGVDVYEDDALESSSLIQLSKSEVLERDLLVFNRLSALKIPQSWCLGGGYGSKTFELYVQFLKKTL